jgi:hypothetical protein
LRLVDILMYFYHSNAPIYTSLDFSSLWCASVSHCPFQITPGPKSKLSIKHDGPAQHAVLRPENRPGPPGTAHLSEEIDPCSGRNR